VFFERRRGHTRLVSDWSSDVCSSAVSKLFGGNQPSDVTETSFVENFSGNATYSNVGSISASGSGDQFRLTVELMAADRFLVLNELYYPGWIATVDGKPAPIYPTTAVMRAVVVPAGATTIDFAYTPFPRRNASLFFYGIALLLTGVGVFVFRRFSRYG